ncbi:MAG: type II toxin-antitoxin system RelE/ParE family toxin [Algicola sp.]|nr:type II toxin-antitoxin system RelE/ParE family toxin [Algicola sp.]
MSFQVRYTKDARDDVERLFDFLLGVDLAIAERAIEAIEKAMLILQDFPFTCRKAQADNAFIRELIIPFGKRGYVALFEIEDKQTVTILAVRHQREDDYI